MRGLELLFGIMPVLVIAFFVLLNSVRILREYERAVIFRFGRRAPAIFNPGGDGTGPGLILLIPFVDKMVKVSLRTVVMDVPPQDVITRDNVSVKVNAVIFFRVIDANKAVIRSRTTSTPPPRWRRRRSGACWASRSWTTCWPRGRRSTRSCPHHRPAHRARGA